MLLNLALAFVGVAVGIIFGAIPGMTATMAVAVFLPMTYALELIPALWLLLGLYVGGISGGLVPAILINVPGTPSSVCTGFDGHPMARRGEGERALKIGITASLAGGLISLAVLALLTPPLAQMAIKFSAVEKFLIILFAMTVIAALSKGSMTKGILSGFLGVLLSLVGELTMNNKMRMVPSFLKSELRAGFQLLPLLIGLFAIMQMFQEAEKGMKSNAMDEGADAKNAQKFSFKDFKGQWINIIRSSLLGTFMGILPGVGGSAASLIAYSQAKTWSKHPELLGTGTPEGLIASESSNNGLTGGALVPLLSLGIPGDSTTAVLIGAFMLQGIQVGPLFIQQNGDIWNQILIALLICNFIMFLVMFFPIKLISKVVNVKSARMYPVILIMCIVGAFATRSGVMFDVWCLLIFGVLGYIMSKIGLPTAPFLIGFILGKDLEKYFLEAVRGNNYSLTPFFTRPIAIVLWVLIVAFLGYSIWDNAKGKRMEKAGMKD
ncbi:MAG: tripartite tricarboxylate transporter permease [Clostridia bacterium]|nr:tripartite tricarboxylate transporter permease [Clostridia bacterium]MBQ6233320.1 tripartite tricarboxylate transporter permease [Clostridia bacterium]